MMLTNAAGVNRLVASWLRAGPGCLAAAAAREPEAATAQANRPGRRAKMGALGLVIAALSRNHDFAMTVPVRRVPVTASREAQLSDIEPIAFRPRQTGANSRNSPQQGSKGPGGPYMNSQSVRFTRHELGDILNVYGRMVAAGEWRDYAIDMGRETASFSVYRRSSEFPLYRIVKNPKLARRQGAYSVIAATGLILKRGHELKRVLEVFDKSLRVVDS